MTLPIETKSGLLLDVKLVLSVIQESMNATKMLVPRAQVPFNAPEVRNAYLENAATKVAAPQTLVGADTDAILQRESAN